MRAAVAEGIDQLRAGFPGHAVEILEDPDGGAFVIVEELTIGERLAPPVSWIGFHLAFAYPSVDVYPHWLRADLSFADGRPLAAPLNSHQTVPGFNRAAVMLSRRSNPWDPGRDSAALKLHRVLHYLRTEA